jgi:Glycosyl transferases group 1.
MPELPLYPFKDYRKEFSIKNGSHIFAVVGRIRPVKGQRIILQSFSELLKEFPRFNFTYNL